MLIRNSIFGGISYFLLLIYFCWLLFFVDVASQLACFHANWISARRQGSTGACRYNNNNIPHFLLLIWRRRGSSYWCRHSMRPGSVSFKRCNDKKMFYHNMLNLCFPLAVVISLRDFAQINYMQISYIWNRNLELYMTSNDQYILKVVLNTSEHQRILENS